MKALLTTALLAMMVVAQAQDFVFSYNMKEMEDVQSQADIKKHFLGDEIALKMQLLKESYTFIVVDEINNTQRTSVEKPSIFYSVKKTEKYLKKALKKGQIDEEEAITQFDNVLNIALNIRYQDTKALEDLLWDIKDPNQIATLYESRVKLEM